MKHSLKDIIKEVIIEQESSNKEIGEKALMSALQAIKNNASQIQPSKEDEKLSSKINEDAGGLIFALGVGAPGLIHALGAGVNALVKVLSLGKVPKNKVGEYLVHAGHKLEGLYVKMIGFLLKKAYPKTFKDQDISNKMSALYKTSKKVFALLLISAAVVSFDTSIKATDALTKVFKGGSGAFKATEFFAILNQLKNELA